MVDFIPNKAKLTLSYSTNPKLPLSHTLSLSIEISLPSECSSNLYCEILGGGREPPSLPYPQPNFVKSN